MAPRKQQKRKDAGGEEFTLDFIQGPLTGSSITKRGKTFRIGRNKSSKLQIKDSTVSEKHGELVYKDSCWQIRDLGSSNGTAVDGIELEESRGYTKLSHGSKIRFGEDTVAVFVIHSAEEVQQQKKEKVMTPANTHPTQVVDPAPEVDQAEVENEQKPLLEEEQFTVLDYIEKECAGLESMIRVRCLVTSMKAASHCHYEKYAYTTG